jgi:hypothetical protein
MIYVFREHHGRDRMEVGFTTTCAISAYHYRSCDFESHSWFTMNGIRTHNFDTTLCDKVCQLLATGRWFSAATPVFLPATLCEI